MPRKVNLKQEEKDLVRRYLVWCYKTTKESVDRTDRYFTQDIVDDFILDQLTRQKDYKAAKKSDPYRKLVDDFKPYMAKKQANALKSKFADSKHTRLNPDYQYLKNRLAALEKAIVHFLGKKQLDAIRDLYEEEMTQRILSAREHT